MQKKMIENIAPIKVETSKKHIAFVAAAEVKILKKQKHLIIDVYANEKSAINTQVTRIVITKKEFASLQEGRWTQKNIYSICTGNHIRITNKTTELQSEKTVRSFLKEYDYYKKDNWDEIIQRAQRNISQRKRERAWKKRGEQLKERTETVNRMKVPEGMKEWAFETLFKDKHVLYYKNHGKKTTVFCSHCGKTETYAVKESEAFESQFERIEIKPEHGKMGTCSKCKARGVYKAEGRMKKEIHNYKEVCTTQKINEECVVVRGFKAVRSIQNKKKEKDELIECWRGFIYSGGKTITDYNLWNPHLGRRDWMDANYTSTAIVNAAYAFPGTLAQLKETFLKYSALEIYCEKKEEKYEILPYLKTYNKNHVIELFAKLRLKHLIEAACRGLCSDIDLKGKTLEEVLRINRNQLKELQEAEGDLQMLRILQLEKEMNERMTDEQRIVIKEAYISIDRIRNAIQYMSITKLLNRIIKYSECDFENIKRYCGRGMSYIRGVANLYFDYLEMRSELGYDMTNSIILHPRDLRVEHDKMVIERNERAAAERINKANAKYKNINTMFNKLKKTYGYKDDKFTIRPAETAGEIIDEGRALHHCVGGDNYLSSHNMAKSFILFMRKQEELETPYVTIEIQDNKIIQWYGAYDKKPDKEEIDNWLKEYLKIIKGRKQKVAV